VKRQPAGDQDIRRPASLAAVAARASVSESTVSRVLRGSDLVAKVTRQRVQAAIAELDYQPSKASRGDDRDRRLATMADVGARAGVGGR